MHDLMESQEKSFDPALLQSPPEPRWRRMERFFFQHVAEIFLFSGLILLLLTAVMPVYERSRMRSEMTGTYNSLQSLVEALMIYAHEQPIHRVFPPDGEALLPGISLCPIVDPFPQYLFFLTTPVAYLKTIPADPYLNQAVQSQDILTPFVSHWVKADSTSTRTTLEYEDIGWGAFSIGPGLKLPPQYNITVLRQVPYESYSLRKNLFSPTNGINSIGLIYYDSLGNHSPFKPRYQPEM